MAIRSNYQPEAYGAALGDTLARAFFGDPAMRQAQQEHQAELALREAQARQANAHAGYFDAQTAGVGIQNDASRGLPGLLANMFTQAPIALNVDVTDPNAPAIPDAGAFDPAAFRAGLPAVIGAMAQMNGDKVDPAGIVGTLAAMMGDDEFARRGMVAQKVTPGENFALTSDRADAISARDAKEDYSEATDVARINHASDIPVANIKAGADVKVAGIKADADRDVQGLKNDGSFDINGAAAIASQFGQVTSTTRSPAHNKRVGGKPNSDHLTGHGLDVVARPGVSIDAVANELKARGYSIRFMQDEGDHYHFSFNGGPTKQAKAAKPKAPKAISSADRTMLTGIIDERLKGREEEPGFERYKAALTRRAMQIFQRTGNPDDAVAIAMREGRGSGAPAPKAQSGPVRLSAGREDAEYAKLASGTQFIGPDGKLRVKP